MIINLTSNALKYTESGGNVIISLMGDRDNVKFCITDSGAGIDKKDLPHIFERFYRADKSRNRLTGGATKRIKATMRWPAGEYKDYSDFGMRLHPIYKKWKMHTGMDIGMDKGANVYASGDGVVIKSGKNGGYGLAM